MSLSRGMQVGVYQILDPIGDGAESAIYKATDTEKERTVTIRVLPPEFTNNAEARQRLEIEVRNLAALSHDNIGAVYGIQVEGDIEFLVSEYLEGETLAQRLIRGALPLEEAIKIAVEMAEALNTAHNAGRVHAGLHPSNILVTPSGAKLLDFGLSKIEAAKPDATRPEITDEFLRFMAPEQINNGQTDARADIFAFGAILYEMVTVGHPARRTRHA